MTQRLDFFAPCPRGVEPLLAEELRRLKLRGVRPQRGGVMFSGSTRDGYRACLWSRLASRVLLSLGDLDPTSADTLYEGVRALPWEDHLRAGGTLAVDVTGTNAALRNTQFTAVRTKDAIVDRLRDMYGRRPSVDTAAPDVRVNVVVGEGRAKISIDLSGEPLHRRGYRKPGEQVTAPIKENLAAAVLEIAGWPAIMAQGGGLIDPMCGSGTIAIEAALMATDSAPGLTRSRWGFTGWLGHDEEAWSTLLDRADERAERGRAAVAPIIASDLDRRAIAIARDCASRAGMGRIIDVHVADFADVRAPEGVSSGLLVTNPPYGERLSEREELPGIYATLAKVLRTGLEGWTLGVITSDPGLAEGLSMRPSHTHELYNGRIPATVSVFSATAVSQVFEGGRRIPSDAEIEQDPGAVAFANRLKKMAKHVGSWARKSGVTCYRVYDADLPDYNIAIDVYESAKDGSLYAHVAEYAPPSDVDEDKAARRILMAERIVSTVLGIDPARVLVKRRERKRGSAQYEKLDQARVTTMIKENDLLFEVNFSDYLDTGLFLDHRDMRRWVRDHAQGTRFLNLFAYTGSATVYAAAGGAASTTTVDLSTTYLHWATRNLAANGLAGPAHRMIRDDVSAWVDKAAESGERYDLVFCDPPTFSNSKRMDATWDVQRDHADLIARVAALLADDGTLVFSCNKRKFKMDTEALSTAGLHGRDITRSTIPKDFERSGEVHSCWIIRRSDA